jgi:hypothetical protein
MIARAAPHDRRGSLDEPRIFTEPARKNTLVKSLDAVQVREVDLPLVAIILMTEGVFRNFRRADLPVIDRLSRVADPCGAARHGGTGPTGFGRRSND